MAKLTPEERAEKNRRNDARSTGPRTELGKSIVARNACTHGLRAEKVALPTEDAEELRRLTDEWLDHYPFHRAYKALLEDEGSDGGGTSDDAPDKAIAVEAAAPNKAIAVET